MPASLWPGMVQTYSNVPAAVGVNSRVALWPGFATTFRVLAALSAFVVGKLRSCSITPLFSSTTFSGWPTFAWMVGGVNFRSVATTFTSRGADAAGAGADAAAGTATAGPAPVVRAGRVTLGNGSW